MQNDDATIGRILSRRQALGLLGALGVTSLAGKGVTEGRAAPAIIDARGQGVSCVVRPAQTLGPYYVDERLDRRDVRTDPGTAKARDGAQLDLAIDVSRVVNGVCTPFAGAVVDIWQCDADGVYSDVTDPAFDTRGQRWLRGFQIADATGRARFTTIYPGWYRGRTVHIHFKVRTSREANAGEFVSQLYFDDAYTDRVFAKAPYAARPARSTRNEQDGIFRRGGSQLMLTVKEEKGVHQATFALAVQV